MASSPQRRFFRYPFRSYLCRPDPYPFLKTHRVFFSASRTPAPLCAFFLLLNQQLGPVQNSSRPSMNFTYGHPDPVFSWSPLVCVSVLLKALLFFRSDRSCCALVYPILTPFSDLCPSYSSSPPLRLAFPRRSPSSTLVGVPTNSVPRRESRSLQKKFSLYLSRSVEFFYRPLIPPFFVATPETLAFEAFRQPEDL